MSPATPPSLNDIDWTPKARAVLAAASDLFYDRGIHAVGVEAIAERAGVTKKTLYDRFGSKEHLVVAYLQARDERWRTFLADRLEATGPAPADRVAAVFDAAAAWAAAYGAKGCSMVKAHAEISEPGHPAYAVITGQKRWMLDLFTDLVGDRDLAAALMLLHEGALSAAGVGVLPDAYATAREEARRMISARLSDRSAPVRG